MAAKLCTLCCPAARASWDVRYVARHVTPRTIRSAAIRQVREAIVTVDYVSYYETSIINLQNTDSCSTDEQIICVTIGLRY